MTEPKKKQGIIYMPKAFKSLSGVLSDRFPVFFKEVAKKFNLSRRYADKIGKIPKDTRLVFIFAGAHGKQLLLDSVDIDEEVKVGFYLGGMHSFFPQMAMLLPAMERADFILCGNFEKFESLWLEHIVKKTVYFPSFFAPHQRYSRLPLDNRRMRKCLLAGAAAPKIYPLRRFIRLAVLEKPGFLRNNIIIMKHPRWEKNQTELRKWEMAPQLNEDYAKTLNQFYCAIATASKFKYAVGKYFEIPAAGALLLGERTADLDRAGFEPDKHYLEITKSNFIELINTVLRDRAKFESIRLAGAEFVRKNHSINKRLQELKKILKEHGIE